MNKALIKRITDWNAARYKRIYNQALTMSLLEEEVEELYASTKEVDMLDAYVDIYYVVIGALWKLGTHPDYVLMSKSTAQHKDLTSILAKMNAEYAYDSTLPYKYLLDLLSAVKNGMEQFYFTEKDMMEAISIVCDSNDSKSVTKTDPKVKANIAKGKGFIPPEARLQELLNEVHSRVNTKEI